MNINGMTLHMTQVVPTSGVQQINHQINTINNGLNSDENEIQQGLDLDGLREAIEGFK